MEDKKDPQPTQRPAEPRIANDPRPAYDPRNPERSQVDISREAKPGTPASRDAIAARNPPKIAGQGAEAGTRTVEPPAEPLPIYAPASHAIPLSSTTAAARPPEGPLLVTLYSVADPNTTMQCMPIDANDHIAGGEWTLAPAGDVGGVTRSVQDKPSGR